MIIAIDGPAGSGKSTTARLVGQKLGYTYIDTGAMYRAVALKAYKNQIEFADRDKIKALLPQTIVTQKINPLDLNTVTLLDGEDVSEAIRLPIISKGVSPVCEISEVRQKMVALQREMAGSYDVIMDGRDIGTVVFPKADFKFYMLADLEIRAERRYKELQDKGIMDINLEQIKQEIAERDRRDSSRDDSPLRPADDAILIDTSRMSIEEQVDFIVQTVRAKTQN